MAKSIQPAGILRRSSDDYRPSLLADGDDISVRRQSICSANQIPEKSSVRFYEDDNVMCNNNKEATSITQPSNSNSEKIRFNYDKNKIAIDEEEDEDYSASISAILHRRASSKKGKRRMSSPFSHEEFSAHSTPRRRSSVFTTTSTDTAISIDDGGVSQEQIYENIRLHKEVITSVKLQPWGMRRKLKLVQQAKAYVKKHEGELQVRLKQSRSTKDILARFNIVLIKKWQHTKRELANFMNVLIPWELRIKEIESHFGSVVASYFTFLRWLFWVNLVTSIALATFVIAPEVLLIKHKDTGERKILLPDEEKTSMDTILNFEGVLKYSPIFYGFYSNREDDEGYKLPTAYFIVGLAMYVYSFIATLRKMAINFRLSKLSEKEDECIFTWKLFTGWDYMIGNAETAHNRTSSIILGFKEALLEEAEKKKEKQSWKIISLRIFVNIIVVWMLIFSAYAVVLVVDRSNDTNLTYDQNDSMITKLWHQNEITIVMTAIGGTFPFFFEVFGFVERYHPRKTLRIQLGRIMALNLLNIYTMTVALFVQINGMATELEQIKHNLTSEDGSFSSPYVSIYLPTMAIPTTDQTIIRQGILNTNYSLKSLAQVKQSNFVDTSKMIFENETNNNYNSSSEKFGNISIYSEDLNSSLERFGNISIYSEDLNSTFDILDKKNNSEPEKNQIPKPDRIQTFMQEKQISTTTELFPKNFTEETQNSTFWKNLESNSNSTESFVGNQTSNPSPELNPSTESNTDSFDEKSDSNSPITELFTVKQNPPIVANFSEFISNFSTSTKRTCRRVIIECNYSKSTEESETTKEEFLTTTKRIEPPTTKTELSTIMSPEEFLKDHPYFTDPAVKRTENPDWERKRFDISIPNNSSAKNDPEDYFELFYTDPTSDVCYILMCDEEERFTKPEEDFITTTAIMDTSFGGNSSTITTVFDIFWNISSSTTAVSPNYTSTSVFPFSDDKNTTTDQPSSITTNNYTTLNITTVSFDTPSTIAFSIDTSNSTSTTTTEIVTKKSTDEPGSTSVKPTVIFPSHCPGQESDEPDEDLSAKIRKLDSATRQHLRRLCWETMFGQELVKLTVLDLVTTVMSTFFIDFVRALFVKYMNKCWCWDLEKKYPKYGDFKIAENILHLVNNQGMVWMGMFFSPGLPLINVVKLMIMMYLRSWAVLTCNVPHEVVFRASRSNNFYMALLLTMLFLCVLPVGYAIVWLRPSWHCGPFSNHKKMYYVFTRTLKEVVPKKGHQLLDYIASPGTVIPLLMILMLIIYYLASLTSALREANNDLKFQLRRERTEERRKMFQMASRRRRGGSEMDSTLAKWRKILRDVPSTKHSDDVSPLPEEEPVKQDTKKRQIGGRKQSQENKKSGRGAKDKDGDDTDADDNSLLHDEITFVEKKVIKPNIQKFDDMVKQVCDTKDSLKHVCDRKQEVDSGKKLLTSTSSSTKDVDDSSIWSSENIPEIKISHAQTVEKYLAGGQNTGETSSQEDSISSHSNSISTKTGTMRRDGISSNSDEDSTTIGIEIINDEETYNDDDDVFAENIPKVVEQEQPVDQPKSSFNRIRRKLQKVMSIRSTTTDDSGKQSTLEHKSGNSKSIPSELIESTSMISKSSKPDQNDGIV